MIPVLLFAVLAVLVIALFLYAVIDSQNQHYANILAMFLAGAITLVLALSISAGTVQDYTPDATLYTVQNSSLGYLLTGIGLVLWFWTGGLVIELVLAHLEGRSGGGEEWEYAQ